jgi:hypothetical protein
VLFFARAETNTWEVERDRLFANTEVHGTSRWRSASTCTAPTINAGPLGLRYGKICILSDADVDGSHIQVLLLTLFFRHFHHRDRPRVCGPVAALPCVDAPASVRETCFQGVRP